MKPRVLVVDDSLTVRMDLGESLQSAGFDPILCSDLRSARSRVSEADLIILDVLLPDGDGLDFLQGLRSSDRTSRLPVLLLSSESEVRSRLRGLAAGADAYVGKPYELGQVLEQTRALLDQRSASARQVLVIDDSATFREQLREALEREGYRVHQAPTGEEGLRLAANVRPDAAIVDGMLPGIDGLTVIHRLKSDASLRQVPCLLLTADETSGGELRSLDAGADEFVRKSDDFGILLVRLAALLRTVPDRTDSGSRLLGAKRLLAVDDSPTFLNELAGELEQEGYDVVLAGSGEEALSLLGTQVIDCVLLDLIMPGLSGNETCHRIKQVPEWRDIPLVLLTAFDDRRTMIDGINAGADDYIPKSPDFTVLKARLRAQLRRKHFEDENRRFREQLVRAETEARFRRLVDDSPDAIIGRTLDGFVTSWNKSAGRILGYSAQEMIGRNLDRLVPRDREDQTMIGRARRGERIEHFETTRLRKDGSVVHVALSMSLVHDALGNVVGTSEIARDLTELTFQRRRFEALLEVAPDALLIADPAGVVSIVNTQAERLFGFAREELLERRMADLIGARTTADDVGETVSDRPEGELVAHHKSGREIPVEVNSSRLDTDGGALMIAAIRDVTERKLAEVTLRRSLQEQAALNRELESFSYSVAHDLRGPLRGIDGFAHILIEDHKASLSEDGQRLLELVSDSARHMGELIDALLVLCRLTSSEFQLMRVDLGALAQASIARLQATSSRVVEARIEQGVWVDADPRLMSSVLDNLLGNAWKFTSKNEVTKIEFGAKGVNGRRQFFVSDNGVGFDTKRAHKLFRVFERLHSSRDFEGTGVGLATVQRVIRRHGGRVWAESELGQGATFWFTLDDPA